MDNLYLVIGAGVLAMLYAFWKTSWITAQDEGTDRMKQIKEKLKKSKQKKNSKINSLQFDMLNPSKKAKNSPVNSKTF